MWKLQILMMKLKETLMITKQRNKIAIQKISKRILKIQMKKHCKYNKNNKNRTSILIKNPIKTTINFKKNKKKKLVNFKQIKTKKIMKIKIQIQKIKHIKILQFHNWITWWNYNNNYNNSNKTNRMRRNNLTNSQKTSKNKCEFLFQIIIFNKISSERNKNMASL